VIDDSGFDHLRHGTGRLIAIGDGFDDVAALERVADAVHEIDGINLCPMIVKPSFQKSGNRQQSVEQDQPHQRPAFEHPRQHNSTFG